MIRLEKQETVAKFEVRINLFLLTIGFVAGAVLVSAIWAAGLEKHQLHKMQYSELVKECIINNSRDIRKVDDHYKCFDNDTIIKLDYDYKYDAL